MNLEQKIINLFQKPETHPTADELFTALVAKLGEINRQEFNNKLKNLTKTKRVYFIISTDNIKHYGLAKGAHCHFICQTCGLVRDFHLEEGAENMVLAYIKKQTSAYGRPNKLNLSTEGLCFNCKE